MDCTKGGREARHKMLSESIRGKVGGKGGLVFQEERTKNK